MMSLNAPFGARCFMTATRSVTPRAASSGGLNAPFGARCFMTLDTINTDATQDNVLMPRLALGAL